ncbi:hypothetical protein [Listeria booriae]|uniref:hypothetical protein n=1 Tax=Listeria booriae TaxID=1552123 RepID=UPI00162897E9|nr:hypothetical protein [Listeria booriae]MBC2303392.1 hypothetical protein [Listeria booriae]
MTQNEKDRKIVNQALVVCKIAKANGVKDDNTIALVIELADRLLAERENADGVYRCEVEVVEPLSDDNSFEKEKSRAFEYLDDSHDFLPSPTIKKGIWIPVEEGLIE